MSQAVELYTDGASRGNPGPASYGFVIFEAGDIIDRSFGVLGTATNNFAEYKAVIIGIQKCVELGKKSVILKSDSQLLIRQLGGQYKVRAPQIKPLFEEAKSAISQLESIELVHVRREENSIADALANQALDEAY